MRVHLCDRCATIIYDEKGVHKVLMQVDDSSYKEEYYKVIELCTDCSKRIIENFDEFVNICDAVSIEF